jgi:hypothetical protein
MLSSSNDVSVVSDVIYICTHFILFIDQYQTRYTHNDDHNKSKNKLSVKI